jgi:hypothetical protein
MKVTVSIYDGSWFNGSYPTRVAANEAIIAHVKRGTDPDYWGDRAVDIASAIEFLTNHDVSVVIREIYAAKA